MLVGLGMQPFLRPALTRFVNMVSGTGRSGQALNLQETGHDRSWKGIAREPG